MNECVFLCVCDWNMVKVTRSLKHLKPCRSILLVRSNAPYTLFGLFLWYGFNDIASLFGLILWYGFNDIVMILLLFCFKMCVCIFNEICISWHCWVQAQTLKIVHAYEMQTWLDNRQLHNSQMHHNFQSSSQCKCFFANVIFFTFFICLFLWIPILFFSMPNLKSLF